MPGVWKDRCSNCSISHSTGQKNPQTEVPSTCVSTMHTTGDRPQAVTLLQHRHLRWPRPCLPSASLLQSHLEHVVWLPRHPPSCHVCEGRQLLASPLQRPAPQALRTGEGECRQQALDRASSTSTTRRPLGDLVPRDASLFPVHCDLWGGLPRRPRAGWTLWAGAGE